MFPDGFSISSPLSYLLLNISFGQWPDLVPAANVKFIQSSVHKELFQFSVASASNIKMALVAAFSRFLNYPARGWKNCYGKSPEYWGQPGY